ncbi:TetR/AcrR family transcriptional regulator [Candidatus Stoquefichus massiliensis]|uniref:TetR/AcrR family transcriptional regulator n=1 Tax=Candidatus Stoquefichus massiliensis TaxID=1470350 RepID=UPI000484EED2|nr:TetR/AcrR family transcriptional regulator [Candidatus Stoquefichus massiliensis]
MVLKEDTRQKLLDSAKQEFLEFGYQKASLRRICKNAGVTTGALYFFFEDKADLYDVLVRDFATLIMNMLKGHTEIENEIYQEVFQYDKDLDIKIGKQLISAYYAHQDIGKLLIRCSQGTTYEHYFDRIIDFFEKHNKNVIIHLTGIDNPVFNECTMHWLAHLQVESFLHILSHDFSEEKALEQVEIVVTFLKGGFNALMKEALKGK